MNAMTMILEVGVSEAMQKLERNAQIYEPNRMNAVNVGSPLIYRGHTWVNSLTGKVSVCKATPDFSDIDLPLNYFLPMEDLSLMHVEDRKGRGADTGRERYIDYPKTTVGHQ
ncbi:hypothetical protein V1520DRAFT_370082 [Lipomyces starkeyi]